MRLCVQKWGSTYMAICFCNGFCFDSPCVDLHDAKMNGDILAAVAIRTLPRNHPENYWKMYSLICFVYNFIVIYCYFLSNGIGFLSSCIWLADDLFHFLIILILEWSENSATELELQLDITRLYLNSRKSLNNRTFCSSDFNCQTRSGKFYTYE